MTTYHTLPARFLERRVAIDLAGCGGNGSQVLTGLARLDRALRALGHPEGLHVTAWDPDHVSEPNVGRQLFSPSDIGKAKATVLITRLNVYYGLDWEAEPAAYTGPRSVTVLGGYGRSHEAGDILITCVDSAKARREIHRGITQHDHGSPGCPAYWLDLGNRQHDGQVILGEPQDRINARAGSSQTLGRRGTRAAYAEGQPLPRLPTVVEVFPELLREDLQEDNAPSCSLAEALETQDLFINDHVSREALQLLWRLFRKGRAPYHGVSTNLETGERTYWPVPGGEREKPKPQAVVFGTRPAPVRRRLGRRLRGAVAG